MRGLRSARSRAILAGMVLVLLLASFAALAARRAHDVQQQHHAVEQTSAAATALEHARAQFFLEAAAASDLMLVQDPALVERYDLAAADLRQDLSQARTEIMASGKADDLATLEAITQQIDAIEAATESAIPFLLAGDQEAILGLASTAYPELWPTIDATMNDLEALATAQQSELGAATAAADRTAVVTFWLFIGFGAVGLVVTAGTVGWLLMSVVRPLAALRASARAVTAGDSRARAEVFGPEEVASLASDFNEMTDSLSTKTEEYIATTNLTGDIMGRVDAEGRWTFLNESACRFYGRPREELLGSDARAYVHPQDLEATVRAVEDARATREVIRGFVNRQVTPTGTRLVDWNAYPLFHGDSQYVGIQMTGRDITERERAEQELRASEERFRSLSASAPIGIFLTDSQGSCIYANPRLLAIAGLALEESLGRGWLKVVHPEDRQAMVEEALRSAGEAREFSREFRILTPQGESRWAHAFSSPMFSTDGRQIGRVGTVEDITERKRAQEALASSEERLKILFESAPDAYYLNDLQGNFIDGNKAAEDIIGYRREELIGKNMLELNLLPPEQIPKAAAALARHVQGLPSGPDEFTLVGKDGGQVPVEIRSFPVQIKEQTLVLGIARDITERKRVEEALRESEEKYRRVVEDSVDGIAITEGLEIRFVNRAVLEMLGCESEQEVVGHPFTNWLSLENRELLVERTYARERGQKVPDQYEFRALRKNGSEFLAEVFISRITYQGRPANQTIIRDITERKRAEEALRESEEKYRRVVEDSTHGIVIVEGLKVRFVNQAIMEMFGYRSEKEIIGRLFTGFISSEYRELMTERAGARVVGEDVPSRYEFKALRKDGSEFDAELSIGKIDYEGRAALQGIVTDITQRKQMEEALRESERRYRLLAENVTDVIWTMDLNLRYTYMSPSVKAMRGYSAEELVGTRVSETMAPASLEDIGKVFAEEMATKKSRQKDLFRSRTIEAEMYCRDGSTLWTEIRMTFLHDPEGRPVGILGVTRDISERKRAEEELRRRTVTDDLTGLHNHAYFYRRLAEEIGRSKRYGHHFALVMMDVDAFKHYNDSRGHQAGDEALRLIGGCIRSAMRRSDIAFRYGGDEFVAILPHADAPKARAVVNRVNRRIVAMLKEIGDPAGAWLGISAGIACFPEDTTAADELVRMADAAMYDAKRLAWARGVMVQDQARATPASASEAVHETQTRMLSSAAGSLAAALQDLTLPQDVPELDLRTIAAVAAAAEIKDPYTRGHQERVSRWAAALAEAMGLSAEQVRDIRVAGLLHDLGKVGVGERILNKPGKLTEEEFARIKEHPALGATMIISEVDALERLAPMVRHHHERFDGKGYPDGLVGEDIPLGARIMSVADVFDAMTHERAYRKALSVKEAIAELERGAGTQLDPRVVEAFLALLKVRSGEIEGPGEVASEHRKLATARVRGRGKR